MLSGKWAVTQMSVQARDEASAGSWPVAFQLAVHKEMNYYILKVNYYITPTKACWLTGILINQKKPKKTSG